MPRHKSFIISIFVLAVSLGVLLALVKSPLASVFYPNALVHSFTLLAITAIIFFICFFSYQLYVKEKDIRYYIVSLSFYILGAFGFIHSVMVPAFGWGNEVFFDISEHYGMFLASFLLLGLIFSFTSTAQEKIFRLRTKIFLGVNFFIVTAVALLFLSPGLSTVLSHNVNFFIGLSGIYFLFLLLILSARKENDFFTTSLPKVLAFLATATTAPLLYKEWNVVWWYYHFLWLSGPLLLLLLLLLLLRAKKGRDITEILFSSFSIRTRLSFVIGLTLVAIVVNGLIDFRLSQNHLKAQMLENLILMADMQEGQILTYLNKLKGRTVDFSSDGYIRERLKKILAGDKEAINDLSHHLSENKLPLDPAIFGIHVMDINGKVVASSQGNEIGKEDMAMDDVFIQAKGSRYANAYSSDIVKDFHFGERNIAIMTTAPIIDQTKLENIGVIMLFFKTNELSDILTGKSQSQFGALSTWSARKKTMEMYLVNKDKLMVSESKSIINAALKEKVDTVPVRLCAKSEEMSGEYLNYQGVSVFGASMCSINDWTLLTEINKDETLASLGDYLQQNLLSGSATFLLILMAMYLFGLGIISPLKELSVAAQKIGRGDFTVRATLVTKDEFGQLSQVFNQMVENIQKSSVDLQQKVKEEEISRLAVTNILGDLEVAKNQIEQANIKLQELDKLKNEFVSIASHELRTPLTAIDGLVSMILDGEYGEISNNLKQPLTDVNTSSERLIHLVNDLLNLSRIQAGRLKYTVNDVPLGGLIGEIITQVDSLTKQKGIKLQVGTIKDALVQVDSDKAKQILLNILGNSIKFTDNGSITVSTKIADDKAEVFITDTGIGIAKEDQQKLFGLFQQLESGKGRPAGTGLGLHISREMTRKMGGDLWIEKSEPGVGSTFAFSIPLAKSQLAGKVKEEIEREAKANPDQKSS